MYPNLEDITVPYYIFFVVVKIFNLRFRTHINLVHTVYIFWLKPQAWRVILMAKSKKKFKYFNIMKRFKVCLSVRLSVCLSVCLSVWSVPIEFPRKCISVNLRNCTYAFPRRCIITFYSCRCIITFYSCITRVGVFLLFTWVLLV